MIDEKTLEEINEKIGKKNAITHILRGFGSPYVETTIGLVEVNSACKHKTQQSDDADFLHFCLPEVEKALKEHARALLEGAIADIDAWLSLRNVY